MDSSDDIVGLFLVYRRHFTMNIDTTSFIHLQEAKLHLDSITAPLRSLKFAHFKLNQFTDKLCVMNVSQCIHFIDSCSPPHSPASGTTVAIWQQPSRLLFVQASPLLAESLSGHHRSQPVRPQCGQVSTFPRSIHKHLLFFSF